MASMIKNNGRPMAEDQSEDAEQSSQRHEPADESSASDDHGRVIATTAASRGKEGFFHIYKSGQGYWTRMGTVASAGVILFATAIWLYQNLPVWSDYLRDHRSVLIGLLVVLLGAGALLVHWVMNKAGNADFLIATDSEMKKVNWTTKAELIGSTKVVILFTLAVTALLFVVDVLFGYFFYFLGVLKSRPF